MPTSPDQPLVLMTRQELSELLIETLGTALAAQAQRQALEQRYSSAQAAAYLGCGTHHLQALHKRGLPYEKGRPNFYRLSDLQAHRAEVRVA